MVKLLACNRSTDEVIIDELTKCYWHAINTLGPLFDPYIEPLVDMLCQCYEKHQYACLLESCAQVSYISCRYLPLIRVIY